MSDSSSSDSTSASSSDSAASSSSDSASASSSDSAASSSSDSTSASSSDSASASSSDSAASSSSDSASASSSSSEGENLTFELIGSDLGTQGKHTNNKWRGISESGGKLYCSPYQEDEVLIIDPSNDTTTTTGQNTVSGNTRKFVDSVTNSDGKIYANPSDQISYLEIDPSGSNNPSLSFRGSGLAKNSIRGGALASGNIYGSIYYRNIFTLSNPVISKFNLTTFSQSLVSFTPARTGGIYTTRPNWNTESTLFTWMYDAYFGATTAGNGKVYLTPYGADRIAVVDPSDDSVTLGSNQLTGNEPLYSGTWSFGVVSNHAYWNKYSGGTFVPSNGCIYCFPRHGNAILKIDTSDDSATEIALPSALRVFETKHNSGTSSEVDTYKNKSFSSVLGPDGLVYSVPYEIPFIFWIDPATDEIGYRDISTELAGSGSTINRASHSWYSYGVTYGDAIYMAPQMASFVMKISFPSISSDSASSSDSSSSFGSAKTSSSSSVSEGDGNP